MKTHQEKQNILKAAADGNLVMSKQQKEMKESLPPPPFQLNASYPPPPPNQTAQEKFAPAISFRKEMGQPGEGDGQEPVIQRFLIQKQGNEILQFTPQEDSIQAILDDWQPSIRGELRRAFREVPFSEAGALLERLEALRRGDQLSEAFYRRLAGPTRREMLQILRSHLRSWREEQEFEAAGREFQPDAGGVETGEQAQGSELPVEEVLSDRMPEIRARIEEYSGSSGVGRMRLQHDIANYFLPPILGLFPGRERQAGDYIRAQLDTRQRTILSEIAAVNREALAPFRPGTALDEEGIQLLDGELNIGTEIPYLDRTGELQTGGVIREGELAFLRTRGDIQTWYRFENISPERVVFTCFEWNQTTGRVQTHSGTWSPFEVGAELSLLRSEQFRDWIPLLQMVAVISALVLTAGFSGPVGSLIGTGAETGSVWTTILIEALSGGLSNLLRESAQAMLRSEDPAHFWVDADHRRILRETLIGLASGALFSTLGTRLQPGQDPTRREMFTSAISLGFTRAAVSTISDLFSRTLDVIEMDGLHQQYRRALEENDERETSRIESQLRQRIGSASEEDFWLSFIRRIVADFIAF